MCDNRFDYILARVGYFEEQFKEVADQYRVSGQFISKLYKRCGKLGILCPKKRRLETFVTLS